MLEFKHDIDTAVAKYKNLLDSKELVSGVARALNKTLASVTTASVKEVRTVYKLKAKDARKPMKVFKANKNTLDAKIITKDSRLSVHQFGASQSRKGTSVLIKDSRKMLTHMFIQTMKNGHVGVFKRVEGEYMEQKPKKEKIKEFDTLSIPYALDNERVTAAIHKKMSERLPINLEHELSYILSKKA